MTEPIGIQVGADVSDAVNNLTRLNRVVLLNKESVGEFNAALGHVKPITEDVAKGLNDTLNVYNKLLGVTKQYAQTRSAVNSADEAGAKATLRLASNLGQLQGALSKVAATSEKDAAGQARTLALYGQIIGLAKSSADAKLAEARATKELVDAGAKMYTTDMASKHQAQVTAERRQAEELKTQAEAQRTASKAAQDRERAEAQLADRVSKVAQGRDRLARADAQYSIKSAADSKQRLELASEEVRRQQNIVSVLQKRYQAEKQVAERSTAAVLNPNASPTALGLNQATTVNDRAARTLGELTRAQGVLTSATNERQRAQAAVTAEQEKASGATERQVTAEDKLAAHLQGTRYALYQVAASYGAAATALLGFSQQAVKFGAEYEAAFAQVIRTTGESDEALQPLYKDLEALTQAIPESFSELAQTAQLGAQMGIASHDLDGFTDTVARFSATTNVSTETAATSFGRLSNLLKVPAAEFANLGSAVSYLGVTSVATESDILKVATSIAAAAHTAGLSTEATLGLSSAFASLAVSPELARSAITRLFINVDKAIAKGGDSLDAWGQAMGMSAAEFERFYKQDPDGFFKALVERMHDTVSSGGDLTSMFMNLGINSVRDVQVFQRLSGSVDLMNRSIDDARTSFAQGNYLAESSAKIFDTVQAKAQMVASAYQNLMASIGQTSVVQNVVKGALDAVRGLLTLLDQMPSAVKTGITTFVTLVGLIAAYKAAMALAMAGTLAFRYVLQNGLATSQIGFKGLLAEVQATRTMIAETNATAAAGLNQQAAAANRAALSWRNLKTAAQAEGAAAAGAGVAASAGAGAAVGAGAAAGAATGFMSKAGKFAKSLPGIGTGIAVVSVLTGLVQAFADSGSAADRAAGDLAKYKEAAIDAGGGSQSLSAALKADQDAFSASGDNAKNVAGYYGEIRTEVEKTSATVANVKKIFVDANGVSHQLSETQGVRLVSAGDAATKSQAQIEAQARLTTQALQDQNVVLGENTTKWAADAVKNTLTDQFKAEDINKINQLLLTRNTNLGEVMAEAVKQGGQGAASNFIDGMIDGLNQDKARVGDAITERLRAASIEAAQRHNGSFGKPVVDLSPEMLNLEKQEGDIKNNIELLNSMKGIVFGTSGAIQDAATKGQIFNDFMQAMGVDSDDAADGLDKVTDKAKSLEDQLSDAANSFKELLGLMTDNLSQNEALASAYDALGKSIADNGTSFDIMTDKGRNNMDALIKVYDAYGNMLAAQIKSGQITAEQAAGQMQQYMVSIVQQLGQIGVPTKQIDFLVDYLSSVTGTNWQVGIGADITGVVQGVNTAQDLLDQLAQRAAVTYNGISTFLDTSNLAGVSAASRGTIGTVGSAFGIGGNSGPKYTGPSAFGSTGGTNALNNVLKQSYANQQLANAEKEAGKAGQDAGKKQADAAKQASDELKKQQEYLKDLADFYSNLGSKMFAGVTAEGKVYEGLQKIGQSLSENGSRFTSFTAKGRENLSSLAGVLDAFGSSLSDQVQRGVLSSGAAMTQFKQFASAMYGELLKAGASAKDLAPYFQGLGVGAGAWDKTSASVQKYSGFITAAAHATKGATKDVEESAKALEDYASRLSDALDKAYDKIHGLPNAVDDTASAFNRLKQAMADANQQVKDLNDANTELQHTVSVQGGIATAANTQYQRYAGSDPKIAAFYKYQRDTANENADAAKNQIKTNDKQIKTIEESSTNLKGNSQAAIDNRKNIEDLEKTILDQVTAYAKAGHTQKEVAQYAEDLKNKFREQITELGYDKGVINDYVNDFDSYIEVINSVPDAKTTLIQAKAETKDATDALNAIPKFGTYDVTASALRIGDVQRALAAIPNRADYRVDPRVDPTSAGNTGRALDDLARRRQAIIDVDWNFTPLSITMTGGGGGGGGGGRIMQIRNAGGYIGLSSGGHVPGTPPANPRQDNVLASGPSGLIGLRSREFVTRQEAADYYGPAILHAMNAMRIPRSHFYAEGGSVGGQSATYRIPQGGESPEAKTSIQITNYFPQAEPASVTARKTLDYAGTIGRI